MATTNKLLIQIEAVAGSGIYSVNCSINTTREFALEASTQDFVEPNCETPEAPGWQGRVIDVLSASINGAGTTDPVSFGILRDLFLAAEPFNIRVKLDIPLAAGGGYFQGPYLITNLGLAKEGGKGIVSSNMTFQSAGEVTWVDAAA